MQATAVISTYQWQLQWLPLVANPSSTSKQGTNNASHPPFTIRATQDPHEEGRKSSFIAA